MVILLSVFEFFQLIPFSIKVSVIITEESMDIPIAVEVSMVILIVVEVFLLIPLSVEVSVIIILRVEVFMIIPIVVEVSRVISLSKISP